MRLANTRPWCQGDLTGLRAVLKHRLMPTAPVNGIEIYYETYGSPDDPALMLINGYGSQMIRWPEAFRAAFIDASFRLVAFDNRDVGLSTQCTDVPPYTLEDMADDAVALLDHLGIEAAHVAGMSMGGMIAQLVAIRRPDRVLSLASIMSTTGGDRAVPATPEAIAALMAPPAKDRRGYIENTIRGLRVYGSKGFPFDEEEAARMAGEAYDRCHSPEGRARQLRAIQTTPDRLEGLRRLSVPTVVIHGTDDTLIPFANGEQTAEAITGAELVSIQGMGHDLPRGAWPALVDAIVTNARRAVARTS
jgi:pimeloyl-ACP methyl ester carboxylesterase